MFTPKLLQVIEANAEKDKLTKTVESQKLELEKNEKTIVQVNIDSKFDLFYGRMYTI